MRELKHLSVDEQKQLNELAEEALRAAQKVPRKEGTAAEVETGSLRAEITNLTPELLDKPIEEHVAYHVTELGHAVAKYLGAKQGIE